MPQTDVVIVGAGASGLSAAAALQRRGIDSVLLLVYTAGLMFVLRFFAGPIVEHINPLGLLFVSAVFGCIGLYAMGVVLATGDSRCQQR